MRDYRTVSLWTTIKRGFGWRLGAIAAAGLVGLLAKLWGVA